MIKQGDVPEGWYNLQPMGNPVRGTRFLPFKVPLGEAMCRDIVPAERFSPAILMEKEPKLRLVVDLTNTNRYYKHYEFTRLGVQRIKFYIPGRQLPAIEKVKRFFDLVDKFMTSPDAQDTYLGVHCTHGVNRTGYFICRYMIERMGYKPKHAISLFEKARGVNMDKAYLLDELGNCKPMNQMPRPPRRRNKGPRRTRWNNSRPTDASQTAPSDSIPFHPGNRPPVNTRTFYPRNMPTLHHGNVAHSDANNMPPPNGNNMTNPSQNNMSTPTQFNMCVPPPDHMTIPQQNMNIPPTDNMNIRPSNNMNIRPPSRKRTKRNFAQMNANQPDNWQAKRQHFHGNVQHERKDSKYYWSKNNQ